MFHALRVIDLNMDLILIDKRSLVCYQLRNLCLVNEKNIVTVM